MNTRTYSQNIGDEVLAVETLLQGRPYGYDAENIDETDDEQTAYRDALKELELDPDYDANDNNPLADYLNNTCLDVSWYKDQYGNTRAEILRTCGGPRCEIIRNSNAGDTIEINTYDAGQPVDSIRVWATRFADTLDLLASEMAPR